MCDSRFSRGAHLTHHLMKKHNFRWPSGHTRFRCSITVHMHLYLRVASAIKLIFMFLSLGITEIMMMVCSDFKLFAMKVLMWWKT